MKQYPIIIRKKKEKEAADYYYLLNEYFSSCSSCFLSAFVFNRSYSVLLSTFSSGLIIGWSSVRVFSHSGVNIQQEECEGRWKRGG